MYQHYAKPHARKAQFQFPQLLRIGMSGDLKKYGND